MRHFVFVGSLFVTLAGQVSAQENDLVLSVTPALAVLGQEIAPNGITVKYPGPPDENASDWLPDDAMLRRYQRAELVLLVGAGYAGWVETTALPRARMINTSAGFEDRFIKQALDIPDHQHGPKGSANHHSANANHFWFDLALARRQAGAIADSFSALWPAQANEIAANLTNLETQLTRIETDLVEEFSRLGDVSFLASHPVYQYLERAFGLDLYNFHWEPDRHPTPDEWVEFDSALVADRKYIMIWEADPLPETRDELERRGVGLIVISPSQPNHHLGPLRIRLGFPGRIRQEG